MANQADIDRAQQGPEVWNAWAQQNPGASVDFQNMEGSLVSLAGFIFPGEVDFSGSILTSGPELAGSIFDGPAYFRNVKFEFQPNFRGVKFRDTADFHGASFTHGPVDFSRAQFMGQFSISVETHERGDKPIPRIHLEGCEFHKRADFSNRVFGGVINFQPVKFRGLPVFYNASIHPGTNFGDIDKSFTDFQSNGAEQSYRTLKIAMGQQQARTEEADFAALELKARRYRLKSEARAKKLGLQRFLSWAERCGYWIWEKFSDSGRSFFRPFALYLAFGCAFAASYVLPCQSWFGDWQTGVRYSFLKQFSFFSALRVSSDRIDALEDELFCLNGSSLPPGWVDTLDSIQSIITIVLIFVMGLGIRYMFRLR